MKSRIWHKPTKSWLTDCAIMLDGRILALSNFQNRFTETFDNDDGVAFSDDCFMNKEHCVIQLFTGLLDKDGTKIWQGDIVKIDEYKISNPPIPERVAEIQWHQGTDIAFNVCGKGQYRSWKYNLSENHSKNMTVIGNIFNNPELLTQKK